LDVSEVFFILMVSLLSRCLLQESLGDGNDGGNNTRQKFQIRDSI